jgi:aspartate kinase
MAVIVQKYGGTSVGTLERIEAVADNIVETRRKGHQVIVVLSAMAGETNRLLALAHAIDHQPATRELDMLLSSAEQVSISLLAISLIKRGFSAISLLAHQIGIYTDNSFGSARIKSVSGNRLLQALEQEQVAVVAGFQGQDNEHNVTTLGRGGSDTSAIAVAVALKAAECQIFTDVDGIYTADPRIEPLAQKISFISFEEMLVMANLGAKVLQNRAVEYAMRYNMPIRVLSSFTSGQGTKVMNEKALVSESIAIKAVSNIAHQASQLLVSLEELIDHKSIAKVLTILGDAGIEIDMISYSKNNKCKYNVKFSASREYFCQIDDVLQKMTQKTSIRAIKYNDKVVKLSAVGIGMKSHSGIAGRFFSALDEKGIEPLLISTSEINISVIIDESALIKGVRCLHRTFM